MVLVVLIQAVFLWKADKGYTNTLSHPEKNLQLSHRKCSHKARVGVGSTEDKKGDLSSKGPVIHSNPDKTLQREGRKAVCVAMLCVREHMYVHHGHACDSTHVCTVEMLCVKAHMCLP